MSYQKDRSFTDYVHKNLAIPLIYEKLQWEVQNVNHTLAFHADVKKGIDYHVLNSNQEIITVQERFRDHTYAHNSDFTLRYTRELSPSTNQRKSEYFKIEATHMIYGITNGKKSENARNTLTGFKKFIVIDLIALQTYFQSGHIRIPESYQSIPKIVTNDDQPYLSTAKLINRDGSSEFIAIDPSLLKKIIGEKINDIVILQKDFL